MACEIKDPTNNPICSDSLKDLKDNAIIMDQYINSEEFEIPDRLGVERKTWAGIEKDAQNKINGFEDLINAKIIAQGGVDILQETGDRNDAVMSQKAVTELTNVPVDKIFYFDGQIPDVGYIERKGVAIDPVIMPKLYARYGTHMPDDRDRVHRMAGSLAGSAGTTQEDAGQRIQGTIGFRPYIGGNGQIAAADSGVFKGGRSPYKYTGLIQQVSGEADGYSVDIDSAITTRTSTETRVKARIIIACNKIQ